MEEDLYKWLEKQWLLSNNRKYHKYFKEWIDNITENQIFHFNRMRINGNVYLTK